MKEESARSQNRIWSIPKGDRRSRLQNIAAHATGITSHDAVRRPVQSLESKLARAAFAFRGYDVANMGRSLEFLVHPKYGPRVRTILDHVSEVASDTIHRRVDLAARIEAEEPTTLAGFPDDAALIIAMETAQLRLMEDFFDLDTHSARLSIGYSVGELTAMIEGGLYSLEQLLPVPLALAPDCAELAENTTMGVLFTREPVLDEDEVHRLCRSISSEGHGLIGPSAFLSPNTALILAEGETLDRLEAALPDSFPGRVMLRRNANRWPPLHSPIVWRRNIPNRAATMMYGIQGGTALPKPTIISCVTGKASYEPENSRDIMIRWTDQPQRLWDAIETMMHSGVETVIHVGPAPNLIPATFARLSNNVAKHLNSRYLHRLGHGVVTHMSRHAWLAHLLPAKAAILRIPSIEHIILEDWLLEQPIA